VCSSDLTILGEPATTGQVDVAYSFTPVISGGTEPYVVTLAAGTLPDGLSLNASTGAITGTCTTEQTKSGIIIRVTDAEGRVSDLDAFDITVAAASAATIPATQTIAFGALTPTGYGAHLMAYTGVGDLEIVSQKDASNADVTIFRISQNGLNWRGASATYASAPPATLNGPYTVVVQEVGDPTVTSTITVNIEAMTAHVREMAATSQGGRWVGTAGAATADAVYTLDATGAGVKWQLAVLLYGTALVNKGGAVTVKCRDGVQDPANTLIRLYPKSAAYYGTTTSITICSENPDASVDENGWPNNQHGYKIRALYFDSSNIDVYWPVTFEDVWFEPNATNSTYATNYAKATGWGISFRRCRASCGPNVSAPWGTRGLTLRGSQTDVVFAEDCTVVDIGKGIVIANETASAGGRTKGAQITGNHGINILEDFIHDTGGEATVVEDNFGRDFQQADTSDHPDFYQHADESSDTFQGPTIRRNICISNDGLAGFGPQGIFLRGVPRNLTGVVIENNIVLTAFTNGTYTGICNDPTVRGNTVLSVVPPATLGSLTVPATVTVRAPGVVQSVDESGLDGTFSHNLCNAQEVSDQRGTVVSTPVKELSATSADYLTALPSWVSSGIYTVAQAKAAYTPANLAVASGGCKNPDDTYNGAIGPDGDWNTFEAYAA